MLCGNEDLGPSVPYSTLEAGLNDMYGFDPMAMKP